MYSQLAHCCLLQDLDDMNIEIMRNTLYKAYLEDFYNFCKVSAYLLNAIDEANVGPLSSARKRHLNFP